jgi:sulfur carrier protein ThiS
VAALIKHATGIEPQLAEGRLGEFAVRVNGEAVARRSWLKLPPDERVLAAVRAALRR